METIKYNNENKQPIKVVLFYAMELVGFNPKNIDNNSLDIIINSLVRSHKDITIDKFKEAFELGANGKLDIDLNTYQNFNTLYVSNVLNAFRRYKISETKRSKFNLPEPKQINQWSYADKKKHFEWLRDSIFLDESKSNGSKGTFPTVLIASFKDVYDYMLSEGMVNELTGNELADKIAEAIRIDKSEQKNPKKSFNSIVKVSKDNDIKPGCYYRLVVFEYFKSNKLNLI